MDAHWELEQLRKLRPSEDPLMQPEKDSTTHNHERRKTIHGYIECKTMKLWRIQILVSHCRPTYGHEMEYVFEKEKRIDRQSCPIPEEPSQERQNHCAKHSMRWSGREQDAQG